jgi:hypothetical protein
MLSTLILSRHLRFETKIECVKRKVMCDNDKHIRTRIKHFERFEHGMRSYGGPFTDGAAS